jgi:hypothetical protein
MGTDDTMIRFFAFIVTFVVFTLELGSYSLLS